MYLYCVSEKGRRKPNWYQLNPFFSEELFSFTETGKWHWFCVRRCACCGCTLAHIYSTVLPANTLKCSNKNVKLSLVHASQIQILDFSSHCQFNVLWFWTVGRTQQMTESFWVILCVFLTFFTLCRKAANQLIEYIISRSTDKLTGKTNKLNLKLTVHNKRMVTTTTLCGDFDLPCELDCLIWHQIISQSLNDITDLHRGISGDDIIGWSLGWLQTDWQTAQSLVCSHESEESGTVSKKFTRQGILCTIAIASNTIKHLKQTKFRNTLTIYFFSHVAHSYSTFPLTRGLISWLAKQV